MATIARWMGPSRTAMMGEGLPWPDAQAGPDPDRAGEKPACLLVDLPGNQVPHAEHIKDGGAFCRRATRDRVKVPLVLRRGSAGALGDRGTMERLARSSWSRSSRWPLAGTSLTASAWKS